jgi:hypothetical protein
MTPVAETAFTRRLEDYMAARDLQLDGAARTSSSTRIVLAEQTTSRWRSTHIGPHP